jgi:hypothetical protein
MAIVAQFLLHATIASGSWSSSEALTRQLAVATRLASAGSCAPGDAAGRWPGTALARGCRSRAGRSGPRRDPPAHRQRAQRPGPSWPATPASGVRRTGLQPCRVSSHAPVQTTATQPARRRRRSIRRLCGTRGPLPMPALCAHGVSAGAPPRRVPRPREVSQLGFASGDSRSPWLETLVAGRRHVAAVGLPGPRRATY